MEAVVAEEAEEFVDGEARIRLVNDHLQLLDLVLPHIVLQQLQDFS
eukprot:CAMPEP_0170467482 /NCGR_PEP_ID=MMETSP0123-20130129/11045_1 /TAXON_ID=182087 /ORGANISM="Favella ehrenbergii, Strain Fehren 1" /LENGTH=45 /DNA_ID= /DNA_START= /DNA_END= /DNA_ORIENTATION=